MTCRTNATLKILQAQAILDTPTLVIGIKIHLQHLPTRSSRSQQSPPAEKRWQTGLDLPGSAACPGGPLLPAAAVACPAAGPGAGCPSSWPRICRTSAAQLASRSAREAAACSAVCAGCGVACGLGCACLHNDGNPECNLCQNCLIFLYSYESQPTSRQDHSKITHCSLLVAKCHSECRIAASISVDDTLQTRLLHR